MFKPLSYPTKCHHIKSPIMNSTLIMTPVIFKRYNKSMLKIHSFSIHTHSPFTPLKTNTIILKNFRTISLFKQFCTKPLQLQLQLQLPQLTRLTPVSPILFALLTQKKRNYHMKQQYSCIKTKNNSYTNSRRNMCSKRNYVATDRDKLTIMGIFLVFVLLVAVCAVVVWLVYWFFIIVSALIFIFFGFNILHNTIASFKKIH